MSEFFIKRPIFAWVISIIVMVAGIFSLFKIPVELYPNIAPPTVSISASLPGASAQTVENSVTQIIEQNINGVDNLRYFSSSSNSDGSARISLNFEPGTDPDIAQVQVQNKLESAIPLLPQSVVQQGLRVSKSNDNFLLIVGIYSKTGETSEEDLNSILFSNLKDQISRIDGVGSVTIFGNQKAMRIWLNPHKLYSYKLTTQDVINAIKSQNKDMAVGQLGGLPAVKGQQINATITAQSRLQTVEQFENIIIKANKDGAQIYLKDIAKIELGLQNYNRVARYKRKPAAGMAVILSSGANALTTAQAVKKEVTKLQQFLPKDVEIIYPYDSTQLIKLSIKGVVITLFEAAILVLLVILLFLQNFRATIIPAMAVPIVLLGTIAILYGFGYSINTLTLFAMVLAIGLLVDDAIVVVENVERLIEEENLSPKEATLKSMKQITGALIGIAVVLSAVFVPMAFFPGSAGAIYRQFSVTIVSAMTLSVFVALILSPSLCAAILQKKNDKSNFSNIKFFAKFNTLLKNLRKFYINRANFITRRTRKFISVYLILIIGLIIIFNKLPKSFLPNDDPGFMYLFVKTPSSATMERTLESLKKVEDYFLEGPDSDNIQDLFTVTGFSFAGRAQNVGFGFVGLKDWSKRPKEEQSVFNISARSMANLSKIKDAQIFTFFPPPIRELGSVSGFNVHILDSKNIGRNDLVMARNQTLGMAAQNPKLIGVRPNGLDDVAQFKLDINYKKAAALGIDINNINQTMQVGWGSLYVNDFIDQGRIKRVILQGQDKYRMNPQDINKWYVKNNENKMVSLGSIINSSWSYGPQKLERFNGISSVNIVGSASPKISSGDAMNEIKNIIKTLPQNVDYAWSGLSYEEQQNKNQTTILYIISILAVFLSLAALYESWSIPFSVMFIIPFGALGAAIFASIFGMNNDIYFQVGFLTTIGLSARNSILIVEFARKLYLKQGNIVKSTLMATKQRFRPILMTALTFILGVFPLALASQAGAASQNAIGISLIGGMLAATFLATLFVPMFYIIVHNISTKKLNLKLLKY